MSESKYLHSSHNVSNLVYHFVTPTKYRRLAITDVVEKSLKEICVGIELRWDWIKFLEIGADKDHVHFLIQSTPIHSPTEIIKIVKSITAERIFAEHPEVKMKLWGGNFWSEGCFVATVGRFTSENVIAEYVRNQGEMESYRQLYLLSTY